MQNAFLIKPIDCLFTEILFKSVKSFYAINVLDNQKVSGNIFKVYSKNVEYQTIDFELSISPCLAIRYLLHMINVIH